MAKSIELAIRIAGKVDKSLNNSFRAAQNQMGTLQKVANLTSIGVAAGAAAIGSAALAAGKQLLDLGGEWQEAANQMASATGAAGDELQDLRDIMEDIYANNFGENVEDVADALAQVKTNMADLPTEQLQTATEAAIALRDALDYDVASTTRAAEAMRKNFGTAAKDAFSLIAAGAQNGLDYSGELLDTISEYSVQFSKLGFDADGMFQVLQSGADSTAWNLDKVGDAIKEFSIRAIDGSDTTINAYEALGYNADETMAIFAKGGDVANAAFFNVLDSLLAVKDQVERDALGVALFGTMWEDLGVEAMTALSQASTAAYDTGNALAKINAVKYNDLDSALEGLRRKMELAMLPAADSMYQAMMEQMPELGAAIDELSPKLAELAGSFTTSAIDWVTANLPSVIQYTKEFGSAVKEVLQQVKPYLEALWEHKAVVLQVVIALRLLGPVVAVLSAAFKVFGGVIHGVSLTIQAFKAVKTYTALFTAWTKATALLTAAKIKDKAETIALQAMYAKDALIKAKDTAATAANTVATKASTLARKAAGGVRMAAAFLASTAAKVKDTAVTVAHTAATVASTAAQKAAAVASYALGAAMNFLTSPVGIAVAAIAALIAIGVALYQNWDTVKLKMTELWTAFSTTFPGISGVITAWWDNISAAIENVKTIFTNLIDFINNVFSGNWSAAWQNIVDIFSNVFGMLGNLVKAPINAVIAAINTVIESINKLSITIPDWAPGGGGTLGFNIPTIPQLAAGGIATRATLAEIGEGGEPEAVMPLSKLAQLLKQVAGLDLDGGGNPGGGDPQVIQFAPVFNFYGPVSREQAEEAGRLSFAEFMKLYKRMKAEEKRKKFAPV